MKPTARRSLRIAFLVALAAALVGMPEARAADGVPGLALRASPAEICAWTEPLPAAGRRLVLAPMARLVALPAAADWQIRLQLSLLFPKK